MLPGFRFLVMFGRKKHRSVFFKVFEHLSCASGNSRQGIFADMHSKFCLFVDPFVEPFDQ